MIVKSPAGAMVGAALVLVVALAAAAAARAEVRSEVVEYKAGDTTLEGVLFYDDAVQGRRPGVLVVHEWWGLNDYAKSRARQLAQLGYVAFAADMYGKGVRATTQEEAAKLATALKDDRTLMRLRVNAALAKLKASDRVDGSKTAAIGYCFGGTTVLELARSGADVAAVVSFHGGLGTPNPADAKAIKAKVLALHGAEDPFVPTTEVLAFGQEMQEAGVDWQLVAYGNAVHTFTNPAAGDDKSKGAAYDANADRRSWQAMRTLFDEVFGKPTPAPAPH